MERIKLERSDWIFILVCLLLLVAGIWFSIQNFHKAFPEASIDFRFSRTESGEIARSFLDSQELTPSDEYKHASRFGYDNPAKIYLEKELGLELAQQHFGKPVRIWYWQHRWFKPGSKEEFQVYVTPAGEVVRLVHLVDEEAEGTDLSEDEARRLSERFLFEEMKLYPESMDFLESSRTGRPNRTDWNFTYKAADVEPVEGSDYRYRVTVIGDVVGGYREYLRVPESWRAEYSRLRSFNEVTGSAATVGLLLTVVGILALFIIKIRKRDVQWKTAVWFGGIAALLMYLNQLNYLPNTLFSYDTTTSWTGFLLNKLLLGLILSLGVGVFILLITASAETIFRERYPHLPSLPKMFTPRGLRTKSAFKGILLGITLTAFFFAYQIAFYLISQRFGAWSPADVPYDNFLNTAFPWLAVLLIGFFPAVSEEFISRMFSIPFLQKAFRSKMTWLALLIPAVIWGFGHAGYSNQPFWIRGAEVGFAGLIIGVIMLRFGILAPLVWHYTVDALYTALLLFRSENPYFILTAAVATGLLVIPLLAAIVAYLRTGTFLPEFGCRNADIAPSPAAPRPRAVEEIQAVTPAVAGSLRMNGKARIIAIVLAVCGITAVLIPTERIGSFIEYSVDKKAAIESFSDSLRASGWADPDTMTLKAYVSEGDISASSSYVYLFKHSRSITDFNKLADEVLGVGSWRVLAWVPENRLRFSGKVHAISGEVELLEAWLPEEMPVPSLDADSVRTIAEEILRSQGEDVRSLKLESDEAVARPERTDRYLQFEAVEDDPRHLGEAKYRRSADAYGNYITVPGRPFYKVPEAWERDRRSTNAFRATKRILSLVLLAGFMGWALTMLLQLTRQGRIPWKRSFIIALAPGIISLLAWPNMLENMQQSYFYQVSQPWGVFQTSMFIGLIVYTGFIYLVYAASLALLGGLYNSKTPLLSRDSRYMIRFDIWFAVFATAGVLLLVKFLLAWLSAVNLSWITFSGWGIPESIAGPLPLGAMINNSLVRAMLAAVFLGFGAYLWSSPCSKPGLRVLLILGLLIMQLDSSTRETGEILFQLIEGGIMLLFCWVLLRLIIKGHPALFFALAITYGITNSVSSGLSIGNQALATNATLLAVLSCIGLAVWCGSFTKRAPSFD